jgi:rod shape determining protein RodA
LFKTLLKNTDYIVVAIIFILFLIGLIGIFSAGYNTDINKDEYIKQVIWFSIMFIVMIVIWAIDYNIFDIFGYGIYIFSIILLVLVLFMPSLMGARSWFNLGGFLYQPSEFMKIGYILVTAKILSHFNSNNCNILIRNISLFFIFIIPFILILLQPDFGTASAFIVISCFMFYISGVKYRYIFIGILLLALLLIGVYFFILNPIQQQRIAVFLDPTLDPMGSGYNAIQSKMAIGSGMIFGTGLLKRNTNSTRIFTY